MGKHSSCEQAGKGKTPSTSALYLSIGHKLGSGTLLDPLLEWNLWDS
jgi:hypothetical protein